MRQHSAAYGPPAAPCHVQILLGQSDALLSFTGRDSEHANPWGEPSPDDYRYGNQGYTDPREREREQHDMNKR